MAKPQRGVEEKHPKNNRFRRLCGLCNLSIKEASTFLDLSPGTVEHKLAGTRGITDDEEQLLLWLWKKIRSRDWLDDSIPAGAIRQQMAYIEAVMLMVGDEVDPEDVSMEARQRRLDEDEPGAPTRAGAPARTSGFRLKLT